MVSIIIPIYNAKLYLKRCLDSVKNQTYTNLEIVCINDGSTDNSLEIAEEFAKKDNRFKIFDIKNKGVSNARNIGILNSSGEYLFFLDADDWLEYNAIEILCNNALEENRDLVVGNFMKINSNAKISSGHENRFKKSVLLDKEDIFAYIKIYLQTSHRDLLFNHCWGKLYKTDMVKKHNLFFNTDLDGFEDIDFNFRVLRYVDKIYYNCAVIYNYLLSNSSQSSQISLDAKQIDRFFIAFESIKKTLMLNTTHVYFHIEKEVGHFYISNMIMILIRACGQKNSSNGKKILAIVESIVKNKNIQNNLKYYKPKKGETIIMPYLIKLRLIKPTIIYGRYRYYNHRIKNKIKLIKVMLK